MIFRRDLGIAPKPLSIYLTLQTVLKLMMLSTDGEEGENSAGKKKRKKKKKKGCKRFSLSAASIKSFQTVKNVEFDLVDSYYW